MNELYIEYRRNALPGRRVIRVPKPKRLPTHHTYNSRNALPGRRVIRVLDGFCSMEVGSLGRNALPGRRVIRVPITELTTILVLDES